MHNSFFQRGDLVEIDFGYEGKSIGIVVERPSLAFWQNTRMWVLVDGDKLDTWHMVLALATLWKLYHPFSQELEEENISQQQEKMVGKIIILEVFMEQMQLILNV